MNLTHNNWSLSLDLGGGRIRELFHRETKIFGTYTRIDGKKGNTHLCVPSFDKEGQEKYDLPFHGLVRNVQWTVKRTSESSITIYCKTHPSVLYPTELLVEQEFVLNDTFQHTIRITNYGEKRVPVNIGIHYYWDTPKGWEGSTLDNQDIVPKIKSNGYMSLDQNAIIAFPHASYNVHVYGLRNAVLWTSFKNDEQENKQFSNTFCCIEPVIGWPGYFGSQLSYLKKGETKTAILSLSPCAGERT